MLFEDQRLTTPHTINNYTDSQEYIQINAVRMHSIPVTEIVKSCDTCIIIVIYQIKYYNIVN